LRIIFPYLLLLFSCSVNYFEVIQETENFYFREDYGSAIPKLKALSQKSGDDKLLYLMEAGVLLHTSGDFESSNQVLKQAEEISDNAKLSLSQKGLSFILSDSSEGYRGEDFERVLIKFYIALNYILKGEYDEAKRYFRKIDFELKEMKYVEGKYKQNLMARYLDALVSEATGRFNDTRVQYKNILEIDPNLNEIMGDQYILSVKTGETGDQAKFADGSKFLTILNQKLKPVPYKQDMGEVIFIIQSGKAAIKESRGRILDDRYFVDMLEVAIRTSLYDRGAGLSVMSVMAGLSRAENPVPIYRHRDMVRNQVYDININGLKVNKSRIYNDFSDTAMASFNENYNTIVSKNVASIATKLVISAIATEAMARSVESRNRDNEGLAAATRLVGGFVTGLTAGASIEPDLRCWHLIPSNFQVRRVFLEPGDYRTEINGKTKLVSITPGKVIFQNIRAF
jgi:hypothetical protein